MRALQHYSQCHTQIPVDTATLPSGPAATKISSKGPATALWLKHRYRPQQQCLMHHNQLLLWHKATTHQAGFPALLQSMEVFHHSFKWKQDWACYLASSEITERNIKQHTRAILSCKALHQSFNIQNASRDPLLACYLTLNGGVALYPEDFLLFLCIKGTTVPLLL